MNILFLSTENPYPPDHGHHLRTYNILKGLAAQNNIIFVGFAKEKSEIENGKFLESFCAAVHLFLIPQGLFKWRYYLSALLNLFSALPFQAQKYKNSKARATIRHILAENRIDLVHCDMLHLSVYLKQFRSLPRIVVNHNVESLRLLRWYQHEKNFILRLYLYLQYKKLFRFETKMCPAFDKCVVVSDYDKNVLVQMCQQDNFVLIPNGVDCNYFMPGNGSKQNMELVWAGAMDGAYNKDAVNYFIDEILPFILMSLPDISISFIGKNPTTKVLNLSQSNPNIRVAGYVEDIRPIVEKARIFIAPHRSGSGTKIKILNAMAQGKAIVTTSIGAEGIEVTPNVNIAIADSPEQFAQKTVDLLQDQQKAQSLGNEARKLALEKYDWAIINKTTELVYHQVYDSAN